jgi:large subunit ribosomal protein L2
MSLDLHSIRKNLTSPLAKTGGRNNMGRITTRHIGGGHKRNYRKISFIKDDLMKKETGVVVSIDYDPNRTSKIALVQYGNSFRYVLAGSEIVVGSLIKYSLSNLDIKVGNFMNLSSIPTGVPIFDIELNPNSGSAVVRSAGCSAVVVGAVGNKSIIKLPSGETKLFDSRCIATLGVASNADHKNKIIGKAGKSRWLGIRPTVRGVAMNPVDHPLGGGEGKTSGGRHPVSPWGKNCKGLKTRKNKRTQFTILSRKIK